MEVPKKTIPWLKYTRKLGVPKKHFKIAFRQYGVSLNMMLQACDHYANMMGYKADRIKVDFSALDQMGKKKVEPICWPLECFIALYNYSVKGETWIKALENIDYQHTYVMAESRINEYSHDLRQNAISRYYKSYRGMVRGDYDGESDLLAPNEALELARLFAMFMLKNVSINSFLEDVITLRDPIFIKEFDKEEKKIYNKMVKWIMETLWSKVYTIKEKPAKDLLTIIGHSNENRKTAVFMLIYYLIGFNDITGNIIHAAGEVPFYEEGEEMIERMLNKEIIEISKDN